MKKVLALSAFAVLLGVAGASARPVAANEAARYYQVQRNAPVVDRDGWRRRASGWDHSCLNIAEPAMFACSGN